MKQKKYNINIGLIGIFSIFTLGQVALLVNPALASLASSFPGIPYSLITLLSTSISIAAVPTCIITGAIAGRKVKYKTLTVLSCFFIIIPGTLAYFLTDFHLIIITRLLVGVGIGLAHPLGNAILMQLFHEQKAAKMQGIGNIIVNASSIFYQLIAGYFCTINPGYTWLIHLIIVVPLILIIFFMPEPEPLPVSDVSGNCGQRLPVTVYLITAMCILMFICFYPLITYLSAIILNEGLGSTTVSGIAGAMFTAGGLVTGIFFGALYKKFRHSTIFIGHILWIAGAVIVGFGHNIVLLILGTLFCGFGFYIVSPATIIYYGNKLPRNMVSPAIGLFSAASNLGSILSSFFCSFIAAVSGNTNPRFIILIGIAGMLFAAAIWTLLCCNFRRNG